MTVKKLLKSLSTAFLYFLVYLGSQFVVVFVCALIEKLFSVCVGSMEMTVAAGILTLISYFIIFKRRKKNFFSEIRLVKMPIPSCLLMFFFGASLNIATIFIFALIPFPESWLTQYGEMSSVITDSAMWLQILTSVIVAPVVEEVVFRGLIHNTLKASMPMFAAMLASALVFGMVHGAIIWIIYAGTLGFLLSWVYEKYKSLLACVCLHFGYNLCGVLLAVLDAVPVLLLLVATLLSIAIIFYVQLTSKNKIEFTMPKEQTAQIGSEM